MSEQTFLMQHHKDPHIKRAPCRQEASTTPCSVLELHSIQPTNCRCKAGVKRFAIIVKVKQRRGEHSTVVVVVLMVQYGSNKWLLFKHHSRNYGK